MHEQTKVCVSLNSTLNVYPGETMDRFAVLKRQYLQTSCNAKCNIFVIYGG